jgi:hypothetical protein
VGSTTVAALCALFPQMSDKVSVKCALWPRVCALEHGLPPHRRTPCSGTATPPSCR